MSEVVVGVCKCVFYYVVVYYDRVSNICIDVV